MDNIYISCTVSIVIITAFQVIEIKRHDHIIFQSLSVFNEIIICISIVKPRHGIIKCKLFKFSCPSAFLQTFNGLLCRFYSQNDYKYKKRQFSKHTRITACFVIPAEICNCTCKYQYKCTYTCPKSPVYPMFYNLSGNHHKQINQQKNDYHMCYPQTPSEFIYTGKIQHITYSHGQYINVADYFPVFLIFDIQKAFYKQNKRKRHRHKKCKCCKCRCLSVQKHKCCHICLICRPQTQQNRKCAKI